jgi:hypothetical protein
MNKAFKQFLDLSEQDRRDVFDASAVELDTLPSYVEKDFWVCLTLDILYNGLPSDHPKLLFKGGTSLSKGYNLIQRFSEDVDFTVFQSAAASTDSQTRKRRIAQLETFASEYIGTHLKDCLEAFATALSPECRVSLDSIDQSTLLFHYPSLFVNSDLEYIQPRVKLEGGGKSALDPNELKTIKPFISSILGDWNFWISNVVTISPERTFWDKVLILHGWHCGHRDENRLPSDSQRLSRHYYDVAMIYRAEVGKTAAKNTVLRDDVRNHTIEYFKRSWMKLEEAVPGSMRLIPEGKLLKSLQADYQKMQGMMLGNVPDFNDILADLRLLEAQINGISHFS